MGTGDWKEQSDFQKEIVAQVWVNLVAQQKEPTQKKTTVRNGKDVFSRICVHIVHTQRKP